MAGVFNSKFWNTEVFEKYLQTVPRVKQNALLKAGILRTRSDLRNLLSEQVGGNFISVPMSGRIGGTALNYDGNTDITATSLESFLQSMIVVGRAKAWKELDFTRDITGKDFMEVIASQVGEYWDDVDQATILSILKGIFGVSTNSFASNHTLDISGAASAEAQVVGADTLNTAVQKAGGDNKDIFSVVIMHSVVATHLENLGLLQYWKNTESNGIEKPLKIASWNGRTVFVDDDCPTGTGGSSPNTYTTYTTYILGEGAFDYCDCGAAVPNETWRDPKTKGGEEWLITRQRKLFAPKGFSFVQASPAIVSPTNVNLETAARWTVVADSAGSGYYPSKAMPFARIISRG